MAYKTLPNLFALRLFVQAQGKKFCQYAVWRVFFLSISLSFLDWAWVKACCPTKIVKR